MHNLRRFFMLDPAVTFLNHGSFGAVPRSVFREYQSWQRELERQPVEFLGRRFPQLMADARSSLARYIHASPADVVFTPNATVSINIVARSLDLGSGDEVLSTDHEYGACDRTWRFYSRERGFRYLRQPIPLPITSDDGFITSLWRGITSRTKVIFLSHITSPTDSMPAVLFLHVRTKRDFLRTRKSPGHTRHRIRNSELRHGDWVMDESDFGFGPAS